MVSMTTPYYRLPGRHHGSIVGLCNWLIVWPSAILLALLSIGSLIFAPLFPFGVVFAGVGWWGIGALFILHGYLLGDTDKPGKGSKYGVIAASFGVIIFGLAVRGYLHSLDPTYAKDILWFDKLFLTWPIGCCVPVGLHWLWLARKVPQRHSPDSQG